MADNYLEKRMEDLRNGRLSASGDSRRRTTPAAGPGYLTIPFPQRRVLIAGNSDIAGEAIAIAFRKAGCKTALFDTDRVSGERLAHDEGIRYHNTDIRDPEDLRKALGNLLNAWRDIDIAVCLFDDDESCRETMTVMRDTIADRRSRLPFPNPFGGRLIIIAPDFPDRHRGHDDSLKRYGFTTNIVAIKNPAGVDPANLARLCLFLCAPGNEFINGANIPCGI